MFLFNFVITPPYIASYLPYFPAPNNPNFSYFPYFRSPYFSSLGLAAPYFSYDLYMTFLPPPHFYYCIYFLSPHFRSFPFTSPTSPSFCLIFPDFSYFPTSFLSTFSTTPPFIFPTAPTFPPLISIHVHYFPPVFSSLSLLPYIISIHFPYKTSLHSPRCPYLPSFDFLSYSFYSSHNFPSFPLLWKRLPEATKS